MRHWRTAGHVGVFGFLPDAGRPGFRDVDHGGRSRACRSARRARLASRSTTSRTRSSRTSRPTSSSTERNTLDAQYDWKLSAVHGLGVGAHVSRANARAANRSARASSRTPTRSTSIVQDRISTGPHLAMLALGYTDHETAGSEVTWNAEYGYALQRPAHARATALPAPASVRPTRPIASASAAIPTWSRSARSNYEVGVQHALDAAAVADALGLPHRHRRPDRLHRAVVRSVRGQQPQRRRGAHRGHRGGVGLRRRRSGSARVEAIYQDPRDRADDSRLLRRAQESLTVGADACVRPGAARPRRARDRRAQGLRLSAGRDARRLRAREPDRPLAGHAARCRWSRASRTCSTRTTNSPTRYNTPDRGVYVSMRYAPGAGNRGK